MVYWTEDENNSASAKRYVDVTAEFSREGTMTPTALNWDETTRYEIDRVRGCVRAASRKAGGTGICYTVMIRGKEVHLYYEGNYRWFVEKKE